MKRLLTILLVVACIATLACSCKDNSAVPTETEIRAICELATIRSYYNNVAKETKEKDTIFQKKREMWIEYEGYADLGVDMQEVSMKLSGNTVTVTIPAAKVLEVGIVDDTLTEDSYVMSADGFLFKNKITTEEQQEAIQKAQAKMEEAVSGNTALLAQAQNRAKSIIENYIRQLGQAAGTEYDIVWKDTN
ncbi:MAG: DUF4230 domain-containing protein [Clostridia bacterium]|nr:DUF4230 domain-containing protein [Clostridia bacterium]